jgi:hypothetical protein
VASNTTVEGVGWVRPARSAVALLRDAWLFFGLVLLLAIIVVVLKPASVLDRLAGTTLVDHLVSIIEMIAEL